ncbi:MAG: DUF1211 domain-containing protein [Saprospiraceae bacterium]|nr:DUF1211 domain-containing protein [Saprospiraceae bacterium]MBK8448650.1 DUF1211 domain-containing protein [Saprospiraceae bacterium]MBK8482846.1 DUF1211 domain-containing protein [Saprospiraceae bacterium]MBK9722791.1 DUF1211 domain-containing protein [Saprospiraceae bacterium]MBK9726695.1 DUF1211 domain-containing protein [Saprospiraceae bacterium]
MNKTRIEAFSDGVLAIIITIMVLEIKIPHSSNWDGLIHLIPIIISYLLSFIYIGIYWVNHHHLFHSISKVTSGILWSNLNLLFWLSLIPFSTGWMGENHFEPNTIAVYAVSLLMPAIAYYILQTAIMNCQLSPEAFAEAHQKQNTKGKISLVCYILAIPFAFIYSYLSGFLFILVAFMWIIPDKNIEKVFKDM